MYDDNNRFPRLPWITLGLGIIFLAIGSYIGLFVAPPEALMGQGQRIMYVHVPTAWNALLALTFAFVCAVIFLFKSDWKWDARMEASIEVGVVLGFLLCCQGSIWAKPTWGVWWDWGVVFFGVGREWCVGGRGGGGGGGVGGPAPPPPRGLLFPLPRHPGAA